MLWLKPDHRLTTTPPSWVKASQVMWLKEPITIEAQSQAKRAGGPSRTESSHPFVSPPVPGRSRVASTGPTSRCHTKRTSSAEGRHSTNTPGMVWPIVRWADRCTRYSKSGAIAPTARPGRSNRPPDRRCNGLAVTLWAIVNGMPRGFHALGAQPAVSTEPPHDPHGPPTPSPTFSRSGPWAILVEVAVLTLWYAAWSGDLRLTRELLAEGADPNQSSQGKTPD